MALKPYASSIWGLQPLIVIFYSIFQWLFQRILTIPIGQRDSGKKLILALIIVLVSVVGLIVGVSFFFISDSDNAAQNSENYLPPNCYSINGKQTCPKK